MFSLAYAGCKGSRCVVVGALPRKEGEAPELEQLIVLYISVFTNPLYCKIHASDMILCPVCGTEAVVLWEVAATCTLWCHSLLLNMMLLLSCPFIRHYFEV